MIRLDTHVVVWLYTGEVERLGDAARVTIDDEPPVISPMVQLELSHLHEIGRLTVGGADIVNDLEHRIGLRRSEADLAATVDAAGALAWTRDPFDRLIVADSLVTGATLLTKDRRIHRHTSIASGGPSRLLGAPRYRSAMSDPTDTTLPVEFLGTMTALLGGETPMVTGPSGTVITATVTSATFAGPKITASAPEGVAAADWPLVRADGTIVLDVRANMRTDDGADIFVTYNGIGVPRDGGGYDIRTAPLFQTGDERYAWLNNVQGVGIGGTIDGGVEYQIYAVK